MSSQKNNAAVKIMGRNFNIKCSADELPQLPEAVEYLNSKMHENIKKHKVFNNEMINIDSVVITALNIAHELILQKKQNFNQIENMNLQINELQYKIEQTLSEEVS